MKEYNFDTREEAINFLDKHNFKYYIPRVCEYMSNIKDELKAYCVELSDSHEVTRCWIVSITDGKKYREILVEWNKVMNLTGIEEEREIFFDIEKVDEFKDTAYNKDYREKKYKEGIENEYF